MVTIVFFKHLFYSCGFLFPSCPNPLDNMRSSVPVDQHGQTSSQSQARRFDVKTFAFVDPQTGLPSAEEVRSSPPSRLIYTLLECRLPKNHLPLRSTSTAGWKSAWRTPTALSSAPSLVSAITSVFTAPVLCLC